MRHDLTRALDEVRAGQAAVAPRAPAIDFRFIAASVHLSAGAAQDARDAFEKIATFGTGRAGSLVWHYARSLFFLGQIAERSEAVARFTAGSQ